MQKTCSFPDCLRPYSAKGLCNSHWAQQRRGHPLTPIKTLETVEDRFFRQIDKRPDECWIFTGNGNGSGKDAHKGRGYGQLWHGGQKWMAHRWSYEYHVRPLTQGEQVDHLCRETRCVNPGHLEAVSQYENMRRLRFAQYLHGRIDALESFITSLGHDPTTIR